MRYPFARCPVHSIGGYIDLFHPNQVLPIDGNPLRRCSRHKIVKVRRDALCVADHRKVRVVVNGANRDGRFYLQIAGNQDIRADVIIVHNQDLAGDIRCAAKLQHDVFFVHIGKLNRCILAVLVGVAGNRAARNACLDVAAIRAQVDARIAVRRFVAANGAARHAKRSVLPGGAAGPHIYAAAISSSGIVADVRTGNGQLRAAISQHAGPAAAPVLLVDNCLVAFDDAAGKHCRAVEQIHAAAIAFNLVVADGTIRHVDRSAVCIHCRALVVF